MQPHLSAARRPGCLTGVLGIQFHAKKLQRTDPSVSCKLLTSCRIRNRVRPLANLHVAAKPKTRRSAERTNTEASLQKGIKGFEHPLRNRYLIIPIPQPPAIWDQRDLYHVATLSHEIIIIIMPQQRNCMSCKGNGRYRQRCYSCSGRGSINTASGSFKCNTCNGGCYVFRVCGRCNGTGNRWV